MPQAWHDFLLLTGTAAATLLGLVFVAASIAATIPNEKLGDATTGNLWVQPIVWAFVRVLVVCAIGVVPGQSTACSARSWRDSLSPISFAWCGSPPACGSSTAPRRP